MYKALGGGKAPKFYIVALWISFLKIFMKRKAELKSVNLLHFHLPKQGSRNGLLSKLISFLDLGHVVEISPNPIVTVGYSCKMRSHSVADPEGHGVCFW